MILAYHATFSAYGFWLPNDTRGSWSDFVRSRALFETGGPTKVNAHRSLAAEPYDPNRRRAARAALDHPVVRFSDEQIECIARGIERAVTESGYVLHGCAIMPDHVHVIVEKHPKRNIERIVGHLKTRATQQMTKEGINPMTGRVGHKRLVPSPWAQHGWFIFLDKENDIVEDIEYVEQNPVKIGRPKQVWGFVIPYRK